MNTLIITQHGPDAGDGSPTVIVTETEILKKTQYTVEQLLEKKKRMLSEIDGINKLIEDLEKRGTNGA